MKWASVVVAATLVSAAGNVSAEQVSAGRWLQTSSTSGDGADCEITLTQVTPQIEEIAFNNGWKGYAHYFAKSDRYERAFQWDTGPGGD